MVIQTRRCAKHPFCYAIIVNQSRCFQCLGSLANNDSNSLAIVRGATLQLLDVNIDRAVSEGAISQVTSLQCGAERFRKVGCEKDG